MNFWSSHLYKATYHTMTSKSHLTLWILNNSTFLSSTPDISKSIALFVCSQVVLFCTSEKSNMKKKMNRQRWWNEIKIFKWGLKLMYIIFWIQLLPHTELSVFQPEKPTS
jgi:hypothetical protein